VSLLYCGQYYSDVKILWTIRVAKINMDLTFENYVSSLSLSLSLKAEMEDSSDQSVTNKRGDAEVAAAALPTAHEVVNVFVVE